MNKKLSAFPMVIALAALLVNNFAVFAQTAEMPAATTCSQSANLVDIPSRRVDYNRLDHPKPCPVVLGTSINLIPTTGLYASRSRFAAFKEQQADLASGGQELQSKTSTMDPRFAAFKERQAEQMSH